MLSDAAIEACSVFIAVLFNAAKSDSYDVRNAAIVQDPRNVIEEICTGKMVDKGWLSLDQDGH